MARLILVILVIAAIALALRLMSTSWRRRTAAGADIPVLAMAPNSVSDGALRVDHATYLGTVTIEHWLAKVAAQGLGSRGPAAIAVESQGLIVERVGTDALFVPQNAITKVELARGLAGRVYGSEGVIVVSWVWGEQLLQTGLRVPDAQARVAVVSALAQLPSGKLWSDAHRGQSAHGGGTNHE